MSQIVKKLTDLAGRMARELGGDFSRTEHRLMHSTSDNLEGSARAHQDNDEHHASQFRSLHPDAGGAPSPHDTGGTSPTSATPGPGASPVAPPRGGEAPHQAAGADGPQASPVPIPRGVQPGPDGRIHLPGETPLANPGGPVSRADYPYLRPNSTQREAEAVPGAPERTTGRATARPDTHPDIESDLSALSTFTGDVSPTYMQAGHTYVRSVGDGQYPNGSFWTRAVPNGDPDLRGGLAVRNEWNGDHGVVTFTPNHDIPAWSGAAGPQRATGGGDWHLPGGQEQIWIPDGRNAEYGIGAGDGDWSIAPQPEETR